FQAEDGIRDATVTGVQTCALPICWRTSTTPTPRLKHRTAASAQIGGLREPNRGSPEAPLPLGDEWEDQPAFACRTSIGGAPDRQIGRASCRERGEGTAAAATLEEG